MAASMLSSSSFSTKSSAGYENFAGRLHTVLNFPLPNRLYDVENLIKTASTKDLRNVLPVLLENVFGFGSEVGWGLDCVTKSYNRPEFEIGRRFLSPEGPLLKLIYALQADPYLTYEFPVSCLPGETKRTLEQGGLPLFFGSKIQPSQTGRPVLNLSAFEFYLFHFAYFLVNNNKTSASWNNIDEYVYPTLVEDYLRYYLPLERSALDSRCSIPSPVRSPVTSPYVHMHPRHRSSIQYPSSPRSPHSSLIRASIINSPQHHTYVSQPIYDQTEVWKCDTIVQIFTEFWLNQNSMEGVQQGIYITQQSIQDTKMPSVNHLRIIRHFVKHLHYFSNSAAPEIITSPYQQPTINPMDEFKRCVRQQHLQRKLYTFLRHAFDRWPLDMSFRLVLETWLSYIQPWRYCDVRLHNTSHERLMDHEDNVVDYKWFKFIQENLLFYTVLWQELLPRLFRMDLSSPFNAYMLFRAVKVLSLPNLAKMIDDAEGMLYDSEPSFSQMSMNADLGGSFLPLENGRASLSQQVAELELPGFIYQPLFSVITIPKVRRLLEQILVAQSYVAAIQEKTVSSSSNEWFSWLDLSSLFQDENSKAYGDLTVSEVKKLDVHLGLALRVLCDVFKIPIPEDIHASPSMNSSGFTSPESHYKSDSSNPDMEETDEGYKLSPLGRYQLVNGIRRFNCYYERDPAELPIKSYENTTLVRVLHRFCTFINEQFGKNINMWCNREDLIGRMACVYFAPPLTPDREIQSPLSKQNEKKLSTPRLNLRFLAGYTNLLTLALMYLLVRLMFGYGPVGFIFTMLGVILVIGFFKALLRPRASKLKNQ